MSTPEEIKLASTYLRGELPTELVNGILVERQAVATIQHDTREISEWLIDRESAAHVKELYGR